MSHMFTLLSWPAVAMYLPSLSIARALTGPLWHSILTSGVDTLGDHSVTVPFEWPTCITPLYGFWVIEEGTPSFVRCSHISVPVEVSWYLSQPAFPIVARRK